MFDLPEINRRNLLIVAASTLGLTIIIVIVILIAAGGGEEPPPPFVYDTDAEGSEAAAAGGAGAPADLEVSGLMLPPEEERVRDWSWRAQVPIGRAWSQEEIDAYWIDPREIAEEQLEDMNESLIRSILGVRE